MDGKVTGVNGELESNPSLVNDDPYGSGWLYSFTASDESQYEELLSADDYKTHIGE